MRNIAIRAENLGKMYRIGVVQESYQTFRDAITRAASAPFRRARDLLRGQAYGAAALHEEIWALKHVSFEIKHGEVVGIIGRNGAGKSTLLKVLSRITEPSEGSVDVYGRVGSLLEVGTGFHPELTGRENVYLNGAILGMSRNDINRKFDEIVDFSGVEKFIDTPVKHYSSGMGLRLGFAVAAHLEPEILIVDEVLAVGDAEFQKKCLGKMSDVAGEGRTVLFVSHNMGAIRSLCSRAILLQSGSVALEDTAQRVIASYLNEHSALMLNSTRIMKENEFLQILDVKLGDSLEKQIFETGLPVQLTVEYKILKVVPGLRIGFDLLTQDGEVLMRSFDDHLHSIKRQPGTFRAKVSIPANTLNVGNYSIGIVIGIHQLRWLTMHDIVLHFELLDSGLINRNYSTRGKQPGCLLMALEWTTYKQSEEYSE